MCLESQAPSLSHWLFFGDWSDFAVDYRSKEFNKHIVCVFFSVKEKATKKRKQPPNRTMIGGFKYVLFLPPPGEIIQFD